MNAAIYARKSTEQTGVADDQRSVARQVDHATAYAERKGWTVSPEHIYIDDGVSGAEFANRPGFLRLMNALKPRPPFQVLILSEVSRLGREQIETAYSLKQLSAAGVRCFGYLDGRELLMESATDKFLLSAVNFAAELEREQARQRTYDAMQRKAKAGHVTGGRLFGYRNVDVPGPDGRRAYVRRDIDAHEADVIRQIFQLCAAGHGVRGIAKRLNAQGQPSPRAQRGRSQSWAPASVRAVLHRSTYRGEIVWNASRKRDRWGQHRQTDRPEGEWIRVPAPDLRIVSDAEWGAAHDRLARVRTLYLEATGGRTFGRPMIANPSPYLLTNMALCGRCGGSLRACSRSHGHQRVPYYGCSGYHDRGRSVCANGADVPMADANGILIEALLDDVLDPSLIRDAVDEALDLLQGARADEPLERLDAELARINAERTRLVEAIAAGGTLDGLVDALKAREAARAQLQAERGRLAHQAPLRASDVGRMRTEVLALAGQWRRVLADDPPNARPILSKLLNGRVTFTPMDEPRRWRLTGDAALTGLFSAEMFSVAVASPTGFAHNGTIPVWREFRAF